MKKFKVGDLVTKKDNDNDNAIVFVVERIEQETAQSVFVLAKKKDRKSVDFIDKSLYRFKPSQLDIAQEGE